MKQVFINLSQLKARKSFIKIILSIRSDGKTTALKRLALESFYESGKTAIFCRRFASEFAGTFADTFADDILTAFPELLNGKKFRSTWNENKHHGGFDVSEDGGQTWKRAIEYMPLSVAGRRKSTLGYKSHHNILIDEYIPLDGRYLPNEVDAILSLYRTVDREHYENVLWIAGNKITRFNPIFSYFNITKWKNGINAFQNGTLDVFVWSCRENIRQRNESPIATLLRGTAGEEYNAGEFLYSCDELITPCRSRVRFIDYAINGKIYGAFYQGDLLIFCQAERDPRALCVCTTPTAQELRAVWLDAVPPYIMQVLQRYKYSNTLRFDNENVLQACKKLYDKI